MSVTPRPEFGKPETGQIRYWFRTDAQMRRAYMTPVERELERHRISERRLLAKKWREDAKRDLERRTHRHSICRDCYLGLSDVGAFTGEIALTGEKLPAETRPCCACLRIQHLPERPRRTLPYGPHRELLVCRVLNPETADEEGEI